MAKIIDDLDDAINHINTLLELDSTAPTSGDEDYEVWMGLLNVAINLWENEEGVLWKQLFVDIDEGAGDGDETTVAGQTSYDLPSDFKFPNSGYVWLDSSAYPVIKIEDKQLYEQNTADWCYFTGSKLVFNPNLTIEGGAAITYSYYKDATALTTGADTFEMLDPMFAVYYALASLTKEEGNAEFLNIATQKLESMKIKNEMTAPHQENTTIDPVSEGFGY